MSDFENGRKLSEEYECHIDNWVYKIIDPISNFCKNCNMTPNQITTLSLITGLISIYFLFDSINLNKVYNLLLFTIFYIVSYILDCLDGYYARKYNMTSKIGDYYDHFKDIIINLIVFVILIKNFLITKNLIYFILLLVVLSLSLIHLGCQECHYDKYNYKNGNSLGNLKKLCPNCKTPDKCLPYTRFVGMGTFIFAIIITVWSLIYFKRG